MATLLELQTRVRLETNRDDIAVGGEAVQSLTDAIARAIEFYADESLWFNQTSASANTVASTATVARPATLRLANNVAYGTTLLQKRRLAEVQANTATGAPTAYAEYGDLIWLYPIPDAVYALTFYGTEDIGVPAAAGDSNDWTQEGLELIVSRTKYLLYRDVWRDPEGAALAAEAEREALTKLRRETRKRMATPLRCTEPWQPATFNIVTG